MLVTLACAAVLSFLPQEKQLPEVKMGSAQLVFLVVPAIGPEISSSQLTQFEKSHRKWLQALWESRQALIVGSLLKAGNKKEIVLLDVATPEEAKKIMADDPLVSSGALIAETHTWYFAKNYLEKAPQFGKMQDVWFGVLDRQPGLTKLDQAEGERLQAEHMANITAMAKEGALLLAGPMGEDTPFRGIFVFKYQNQKDIEKLTKRDPLISGGRLKLSLFQWQVPKGSFLMEVTPK